MALDILLVLLYSVHDYFVIESYGDKWNAKFMRYWHQAKLAIVVLTGYMIHGFTIDYIVFFLIYYIIFEPVLNILRKKDIFYVGTKGLDKLRRMIFGKYVMIAEGILRIAAIVGIVLLK